MDEILLEYKKVFPYQQSHTIKLDLTDFASIRSFAAEYIEKVGRLDVMINNAGIMIPPLS